MNLIEISAAVLALLGAGRVLQSFSEIGRLRQMARDERAS